MILFENEYCNMEILEFVKLQEFTNCFVFEISIKAKKAFTFNPQEIRCIQGENITLECKIDNLNILEITDMKRYEKIKGHIAFRKNYIGTLKPVIEYQKVIKKVDKNVFSK